MQDRSDAERRPRAAVRVSRSGLPQIDDADRLQLLETIVELSPVGASIVALDGTAVLTNGAVRDMLGYTEEQFASLHFSRFTHPDDVEPNESLFRRMVTGELEQFDLHKRFFRADGSLMWGWVQATLVRGPDGTPLYVVGMLQDVTELKRLEHEAQAAELHYRVLVERVPSIVYTAEPGPDGRWRYVSPQIERMLGYTPQEWCAERSMWASLLHPDDREAVIAVDTADAAQFLADDAAPITYRLRRRDGSYLWVRDAAVALPDENGLPLYHGVLNDVSAEKTLEAALEYQARHDQLTGLANRAYFTGLLEETVAELPAGGRATVLFVDLDRFKSVNDLYGHATGDQLLQAVAEALRRAVGERGVAARIGGDEFAVLAAGVDDASGLARDVVDALWEAVVERDGQRIHAAASVGLAVAEPGTTGEQVLMQADQAMYRVKVFGGGGFGS